MRMSLAVAALLISAVQIHGDVRGSAVTPDGKPVAGARVELAVITTSDPVIEELPLATATTDAKGAFKVPVEKPGNYRLTVSAAGHAPSVVDTTGAEDLGGIALRPAAMKRIRLMSSDGKPVANATIISMSRLFRTTSGDDGSFLVPEREPWDAPLVIVHRDYARLIDSGSRSELRLDQGVALRGRVVMPDGETGAKATLYVDGTPAGETNDDGAFAIEHAPSQWQQLEAVSGDLIAHIRRGGSPASMRLGKGITVRGSVVDATSRLPLEGAIVSLETEGGALRTTRLMARTDAKGTYVIPGVLPAANYRIVARSAGFLPYPTSQAITSTTPSRTLYLQKAARISGVVTDGERKPVAGIEVRAIERTRNWFSGGANSPLRSGSDGRYLVRVPVVVEENGQLDLIASRNGFASTKDGPHQVPPGEEKTVNLTLDRGVALRGVVKSAAGEPLRGVSVGAQEIVDPRMMSSFVVHRSELPVTDAEGRFELRLRPATYALHFQLSGYAPKKVPDLKASADTAPLEVTLEPAVSISGRVVSADGTPLPDYRVAVHFDTPESAAVTDASGAFTIGGLPATLVTVEASSPDDGVAVMRQIKAPAENVVIEMLPTISISGRVIAKSGRPISDYTITLARPRQGDTYWSGQERSETVHDSGGRFHFATVPVMPTELQVTAAGYAPANILLQIEKGKNLENIEVALDRAGTVRGRVTTETGAPIGRAVVSLDDQSAPASASTDANGEYLLESVPMGESTLRFFKPGFVGVRKTVRVDGSDVRADVQLPKGKTLTGRVVNEAGAAVAEVEVVASTAEADGGYARAISDAAGRFQLEGLSSGIYRLRASRRGYVDPEPLEADLATTSEVTLTMRSGATLTGRVSGIDPKRFGEVRVVASSGGRGANAVADANGTYRIEAVIPGKVMVRAVAASGGQSRTSEPIEVAVQNGATHTVDIEFREHNTLRGRVSRRGVPMQTGTVIFSSRTERPTIASAAIDPNGNYEVSGVPSGEVTVTVFDQGTSAFRYSVSRTITGSQTLDLDLNPATYNGRILNEATGEPVVSADVVLAAPQSPQTAIRGQSGSDGRVILDSIAPGTYELRIAKEGFASHLSTLTIAEGATAGGDVRLTPSAGITIRAVDGRTGRAVNTYVVVRTPQGTTAFNGWLSPRPDGTVNVPAGAGSYRVHVMAESLATVSINVNSPASETVTLLPGGALVLAGTPATQRGRIVDSSGAEYFLHASADPSFPIKDGTRVPDFVPGSYTLQLLDTNGQVVKTYPFTIRLGETTRLAV